MPKDYSAHTRLIQDITRLDEQLLTLLSRRARLIQEELRSMDGKPGGQRKDRGSLDPELEKAMWRTWEAAVPPSRRDTRLWRTLFTLVQELPPGDADLESEDGPQGFSLTPRPGMTEIRAPGPGSHLDACLNMALAAQAEAPFSLPGVVLNDPLISLVKALNQAGAALHWDDDGVKSRGGAELSFAGKVVFAGDSPLTLHLLMALSLAGPGRAKFTGGPMLKLMDMAPLIALFPLLGARLSPVIPGCPGLPARIEASAMFPGEVLLPANYPLEAAAALAVAAPCFTGGLTLRRSPDDSAAPMSGMFAALAELLQTWSVEAQLGPDNLRIPQSRPRPPQQPRMPMDPLLGAWLLCLPLFVGLGGKTDARAVIEGFWPKDLHPWSAVGEMLARKGLGLDAGGHAVTSLLPRGARPTRDPVVLDTSSIPAYFPLSVALGAALARAGTPVRLTPPTPKERGVCAEFLERLGLRAEEESGALALVPMEAAPPLDLFAPWLSPDPRWTLAYGLAGFLRPGLTLANPGGVTELMPGFWALYNGLPEPPRSLGKARGSKKEKEDDGKRRTSGRRIRL